MSRLGRWVALAAVIGVVAFAALYAVRSTIGEATTGDAGWLDSQDPVQGRWVSRAGFAYDGSTPWSAPVRLRVIGNELRFDVGCNRMTASATVEDHRLRSEQGVVSTRVGCPPEVAAHEAWLVALVADRAQVQLQGSTEGAMFTLNSDAGWIGFTRD